MSVPDGNILPHPEECGSYIECNNNVAVMRRCATNFLFDASVNTCVNDFIANCGGRSRRSVSAVVEQPVPSLINVNIS